MDNYYRWMFPKIVVPQNGWFIMENPINRIFNWIFLTGSPGPHLEFTPPSLKRRVTSLLLFSGAGPRNPTYPKENPPKKKERHFLNLPKIIPKKWTSWNGGGSHRFKRWVDETISSWWQLKIFFYVHPYIPGEMIQFDEHIFQMGWFNHQPVKNVTTKEPLKERNMSSSKK